MDNEKLTLEAFGQQVKLKHPEYKDMDDTDLATKMLAKYPQYKDMVVDIQAPAQVTPPPQKKNAGGTDSVAPVVPPTKPIGQNGTGHNPLTPGTGEQELPLVDNTADTPSEAFAALNNANTRLRAQRAIVEENATKTYFEKNDLTNEVIKAHNEVEDALKYVPLQQLSRLYHGAQEAATGRGPSGGAELLKQQIEEIRRMPVNDADKNPVGTGGDIIKNNKPLPYKTYGEMFDATAAASKVLNEKVPVLDKKAEELQVYSAQAKHLAQITGDYTGPSMGYAETFGHSFGNTLDNVVLGMTNLVSSDEEKKEIFKRKFVLDNVLYPKGRPQNAGGYIAESLGGVAPYVAATIGTGGEALPAMLVNALGMGLADYGAGQYEAFTEAKNNGKTDDEAMDYAKKMGAFRGTAGVAMGAALPLMGAAGEKLFLNDLEAGAFKKFMAGQGVMAPTFGANQLSQNIFANSQGADREVMQGFGDAVFGSIALGGMLEAVHSVPNLPAATRNVFENALAKRFPEVQMAVDNAVNKGIITGATGEKILGNLRDKAIAFAKMPKDLAPETEQKVVDMVVEKANLEKQKEKTDEAFHPEIESKQEELDRQIREETGAPLNDKEKAEYGKLETRSVDSEKPLNDVERERLKHLKTRMKSNVSAATVTETPQRVTYKDGRSGLLLRDEEGSIEFIPDGNSKSVVFEKGGTIENKSVRELGFKIMPEQKLEKPNSQIVSGEVKVGAEVLYKGERYTITENKNAPEGIKTDKEGKVRVLYLKDKEGKRVVVGANNADGKSLIADANKLLGQENPSGTDVSPPAEEETPKPPIGGIEETEKKTSDETDTTAGGGEVEGTTDDGRRTTGDGEGPDGVQPTTSDVAEGSRETGLGGEVEKPVEETALTPPKDEGVAEGGNKGTSSNEATKEKPFVTANGKYKVYREGDEIVVKNSAGKDVPKATAQKYQREFKDNYKYDTGKYFSGEAQDLNQLIEQSENPAEIALVIKSEPKYIPEDELDFKERAIEEVIGHVSRDSYVRHGDENNIGMGIAKGYLRKDGQPLDQIALEAETTAYGDYNANSPRITEQDVIDFMHKYPDKSLFWRQKNEAHAKARARFKELTGFDADSKTIKLATDEYHNRQKDIPADQGGNDAGAQQGLRGVEQKTSETVPAEGDTERQQQQERLDAAKEAHAKVKAEYDVARSALDKDLAAKQGGLFEGKEQKLFDDTAEMTKRVADLKTRVEEAKAEMERAQDVVDSNLEGQAEFDLFSTKKAYENIAGLKPNTQTGRIPVEPITGGTPKQISEIVFDVTKGTKQRLFFAKPGARRGSIGTYSPGNTAVKIRYTGDLDTTAHELGHSIDDHFGVLTDMVNNSNLPVEMELSKFSPFGSTPPKGHPNPRMYRMGEGFAEWLRAYIVNPEAAKREAPNTYAIYESKVHEEYKKAVDAFSTDVRTFAGASGRDMVLANVEWKSTEKKGLIGQILSKSDAGNMFTVTWADKLAALMIKPMRAFDKANEYLKGIRGIDEQLPENDPELLARGLLRIDGKVSELLESGMIDSNLNVLKDAEGNVKNLKWLLEPLDNTDPASIERDVKDVAAYMIAERTVELGDKFDRQSVLTGVGGGIFKDVDVARKTLDEFTMGEPERLARIQKAAARYREMADDVMKYMVDMGRLSQANYDEIKANSLQYVGLQRVIETEPGREIEVFKGGGGGALGSKTEVIKSIKGSSKAIQNPYISLMDTLYKGVKEADRNAALLAFREMLVSDRGMYEGAPDRFADIGVKAAQEDKETIPIFVDGKAEHWKFQKDIYTALKNMDSEGYKLPGVVTALPKLLRWTVTHFPVFGARNVVRDTQARIINSNENSWRNAFGIKDLVGDSEHWHEIARAGGLGAGHYMKDKAHYDGLLQVAMHDLARNKNISLLDPVRLKKLWNGYENILGKSETVNRVAEYRAAYRTAKAKGMDDYNAKLYAGYKAADLMDFAVMGHWMRVVNQVIPFSNAAVQGLRSAAVRAKENPGAYAVRMAAFSVVPAIAEWLINNSNDKDKKQYESLPDYQRDMFYNFKIGENKWATIPRPFELAMPGSGVSRALSFSTGKQDAFDGYAGSVAKTMLPFDESNILGPYQVPAEILTNKDLFRNKSIIPPHEDALNLALRNTERASRFGKALENVAGIDARKIDFFVKGTTSYYGNLGLKLSDIGRKDEQGAFELSDLGFFKQTPAYNSKPVQEFLDFTKQWGLTGSKEYKEFKRLAEDYFNAKDDHHKEQRAKVLIDYAESEMRDLERRKEKKIEKHNRD